MKKDEALKLALETLEYAGPSWIDARQPAITAIKEALAQPEQEPVGDFYITKDMAEHIKNLEVDWTICASGSKRPTEKKVVPVFVGNTTPPQPEKNEFKPDWDEKLALTEEVIRLSKRIEELEAQPSVSVEQSMECGEPVAWISHNAGLYHFKPDESLDPLPLYLTPPPVAEPHKRKPLTDEEIAEEFYKFEAAGAWYQFARAIEAAHGIEGQA